MSSDLAENLSSIVNGKFKQCRDFMGKDWPNPPLIEQHKIGKRVESLKKRKQKIDDEIRQLQTICTHPDPKKEPKLIGDGYYDKGEYVYFCSCLACGKRWTIPQ